MIVNNSCGSVILSAMKIVSAHISKQRVVNKDVRLKLRLSDPSKVRRKDEEISIIIRKNNNLYLWVLMRFTKDLQSIT